MKSDSNDFKYFCDSQLNKLVQFKNGGTDDLRARQEKIFHIPHFCLIEFR